MPFLWNKSSNRPAPAAAAPAPSPSRQAASFIDPHTLMRIKSLHLRARVVVQGFLSGLHRSPHHGFSVEFSEYRQYSPGDDPRHLDWKLFARSDRYYIKRFEDETNLRCHLLVDLSRSMGFGSVEYTKVDYARTAAATLAYFSGFLPASSARLDLRIFKVDGAPRSEERRVGKATRPRRW